MDLSKIDSKIQIESRLADVRSALKEFDQLTAKAEKLEAELAKLKDGEKSILADRSRSDEAKLDDLLRSRAAIDLKQSAVTGYLGEKSKGNNVAKEPGKIEIASKAVHDACADVGRFLNAFHDATKVLLRETIQETTKAFIRPEDGDELMNLASRSYNVRQIHLFNMPVFHRDHNTGYQEDIRVARTLDNTWSDLLRSADAIGGELAVSIPDPWLD